jgi:hypothetical protein
VDVPHEQARAQVTAADLCAGPPLAPLAEALDERPQLLTRRGTIIFHLGGAVGRQDPEGSAFEDRRAAHAVNIDAVWSEPARAATCIAWTQELWEAVRPYSTGRVYVNFLGEEGQDRVRAAYGEAKYERLRARKRKYDPTSFFRLNQNIRP